MYQYTIDDYRRYLECPKKFAGYYHEKIASFSVTKLDDKVYELLNEYLMIHQPYLNQTVTNNEHLTIGWYQDLILETKRLKGNIKRAYYSKNGLILYFVSIHTYPSIHLKNRICAIVYLCNQLDIPIDSINIVYFNKNYVYNGKSYYPKQIFKTSKWLTSSVFDFKLYPKKTVNAALFEQRLDLMDNILENGYNESDVNCHKDHLCAFLPLCEKIKSESYHQRLIDNYHLGKSNHKGIKKIQTQCALTNENYVNKKALKNWLRPLKYPYFFIDFEWERKILPWIKGQHLFNDFVFEYALVKVNEDQTMEQKVVICDGNDNLELFNELFDDLQNVGTIFAYNANGGEIVQLKSFYKDRNLENEKIFKIIERIVSIDIPLTSGMIYHLDIKGGYSLKNIASIISFNDYASIECQSGLDAVRKYRSYLQYHRLTDKQDLIEYCKSDALALFSLLNWYQSLVFD